MKQHLILTFLFAILYGWANGQITEAELKAQKDKLQQQNASLKKEISGLNKDLQRNQSESKTSLLYVQNLDKKITAQSQLVNGLTKEKKFIEDEIYLTQLEINKQSRELVELRKEYKEILVKAYKNKSVENKLLFVLSSESLSQAFRRIKYIEKYSEYQLGKADEILGKTKQIEKEKAEREKSKKEKEAVLAQQSIMKDELEVEKGAKQKVIEEYKKNAGVIAQQIAEKQRQQKSIDGEIKRVIDEEIRLAKIRAEKDKKDWDSAAKSNTIASYQTYLNTWPNGDYSNAAKRNIQQLEADNKGWQTARSSHSKAAYQTYLKNFPQGQFASTARVEIGKFEKAEEEQRLAKEKAEREAELANKPVENVVVKPVETPKPVENPKPDPAPKQDYADRSNSAELSSDFANNRGRLPWPVSRGSIVQGFGEKPHPHLPNIIINNDGVDIATNKGSNARAVFEGEVSAIISIPGGNRTLLIRHGSYYTVYNNLSFVSVKKGDKVKRGQDLGRIYTDENGDTILKFEVRSGSAKQNPESWLGGN